MISATAIHSLRALVGVNEGEYRLYKSLTDCSLQALGKGEVAEAQVLATLANGAMLDMVASTIGEWVL